MRGYREESHGTAVAQSAHWAQGIAAGAKEPHEVGPSEVDREFAEVERQLTNLTNTIGILTGRLSSVVRPELTNRAQGAGVEPACGSPLGCGLQALKCTLRGQIERLDDLVDRLAL